MQSMGAVEESNGCQKIKTLLSSGQGFKHSIKACLCFWLTNCVSEISCLRARSMEQQIDVSPHAGTNTDWKFWHYMNTAYEPGIPCLLLFLSVLSCLSSVFTKLLLEAKKKLHIFAQIRAQTVSENLSAMCMCEILLTTTAFLIPLDLNFDFNKPAARQPCFSACWLGGLCSDSLVSMQSASESASLGFSNISVAADQGIFMGFHNAMIIIKHLFILASS